MYAFISYSHKDKKHVEKAIEALKSEGFDIWYDKGIRAGEDWAEKIGNSLSGASAVILFLSKDAVNSRNVLREIDFAQDHNIPVFTVLIKNPKLSEELERKLFVNQAVQLFSCRTYEDLAKELSGALEKIIEKKPSAYAKKVRIKKGGKGKWIMLAIIIIIAGIIIGNKALFSEVPLVKGMLPDPGRESVESAGYDCSIAQDYSDEEDYGYIYRQSESGKTIKTHPIVITQSLGPESNLTDVPDIVGLYISDGVRLLVEAGINKFTISPVKSNDFAESYIAAQSIPGGLKVSKNNSFSIDVVTGPKGYSFKFNNKTYTLPPEQKLLIEIGTNGAIDAKPVILMEAAFSYEEKMNINAAETVDATMIAGIDVSREGTDVYGKFRGRLSLDFNIDASKDSSLLWSAIKAVAADDNGIINIHATSDGFSFELEEFDDEKLRTFVGEITGNPDDTEYYENPTAMAVGHGFAVNEMSSILNILKYTELISGSLNFSIPALTDGYLNQPYYILLYEDGRVSVSFAGTKGNDRIMTFSGYSND